MKQYLLALWRVEPARTAAVLAYLLVFVAAKAGVIIDAQSVVAALLIGVPILLGGEAARAQVVPLENLKADPQAMAPDVVNQP